MGLRRLLLCLLAITSAALAEVQFTYPAAGDSIPAGTITVKWVDSSTAPSIDLLKSYTLQLMVGGNDPSTSKPLISLDAGPGEFSAGNSVTGTIDPSLAGTLKNGFYLQMISTAKDGGTITNFSDRFTMTGMTGTTPEQYVKAVEALGGSTAGPSTENDIVAKAAPAAAVAPAAAPAQFNVPYNLQTGLSRFAPMQPVPPTKIVAKDAKPLFPTSAFNIAKVKLPPPTILTTLTQSQTFSVHSIQNTAAAQTHPQGDKAKFLARWKD